MEKERDKAGWASWNADKVVAMNRKSWTDHVKALCRPTGAKKDDDGCHMAGSTQQR